MVPTRGPEKSSLRDFLVLKPPSGKDPCKHLRKSTVDAPSDTFDDGG